MLELCQGQYRYTGKLQSCTGGGAMPYQGRWSVQGALGCTGGTELYWEHWAVPGALGRTGSSGLY